MVQDYTSRIGVKWKTSLFLSSEGNTKGDHEEKSL